MLSHDIGVNDINDHGSEASESSSSFFGHSDDSMFSSSSPDVTDDASSSLENCCNISKEKLDSGSLFELNSLMDELPIKRGLSNYYQGKSQSFASVLEARCVQDLAKKQICTPHRKRMIISKSYVGLDSTQNSKPLFAPGPFKKTIVKKSYRNSSCASSIIARRNISSDELLSCCKPPLTPSHSHKNISHVN